jgi:hypothetical protein
VVLPAAQKEEPTHEIASKFNTESRDVDDHEEPSYSITSPAESVA